MAAEHALVRTAGTGEGEAFDVVLEILLFSKRLAAVFTINATCLSLFARSVFRFDGDLTITLVVVARHVIGRL